MERKLHLFGLLLTCYFVVLAQPSAGYYNSAEGKSNAALKTALFNIIKNPDVLDYSGLWTAFRTTDNLNGKVWDMYSNCSFTFGDDQCGNYTNVCDCYNREHSFPKNWFNDASPMISDLFHLYPTDGKVNGMRSNFPFGEVGSGTAWGTGKLGAARSGLGYSGTVFEPADEYKGDFARTYFYMITCYEDKVSGWSSDMLSGGGYTAWAAAMLLEWHRNDPVSEKETNRNNAVEGFQDNRNPFIDYPELVEHIWGNKKGEVWSLNDNSPRITLPVNGAILDFGAVAYMSTKDMTLQIKGVNLTGDLNIAISGTNASLFGTSRQTITKDEALGGYTLTVSFEAENTGEINAALEISGGGASAISVNLKAVSFDGFMALPATFLSTTGFTANWTISEGAAGYTLNVYSMEKSEGNASQTYIDQTFVSGLPSDWTQIGYVGEEDNMLRLASSSQNGSITTPVIHFDNKEVVLTVEAMQYRNDNSVLTVLLDGSEIAAWQTSGTTTAYTVDMAPAASGKITLSAQANHRIYITSVKVTSKLVEAEKTPVTGYPKPVGNVLSYQVTGLESDSLYYYTVTPEGNGAEESNTVSVHTLGEEDTGLPENKGNTVYWETAQEMLYVYNLPENCSLRLIDISGKAVIFVHDTSFDAQIPLPQRGVYILQVIDKGKSEVIKILY